MIMTFFRGPITGPKFFAIFASFFVVIIGVNLVMAFQAINTFPGLEVANSYVASQTFDDDRASQEALGWSASALVHEGELILSLTGMDGQPAEVASVAGIFGRPTSQRDDQLPAFTFDGTVWRAPVLSDLGQWNLRLDALATDGTSFRQRIVVVVD
jgi:nitrogen fixation protein FixH